MRLWKKAIVLVLCLTMVLGIAGCSKKEGNSNSTSGNTSEAGEGTPTASGEDTKKEPVALEWYYRGNGMQKDTQMVEDKLNELLKSYEGLENVTIHLNCYIADEYANAITLAQSAGKQIDILNTVNLQFPKEVANGTFLPLNDYVNALPELKDAIPQWLWDLGSIDGNIYIVPNYQRAANMMYFITPKAWLDKYGDEQKFTQVFQNPSKTPAEVEAILQDYLLAIREGEGGTRYLPGIAYGSEFGFSEYFDNIYDANMYVKFYGSQKAEFLLTRDMMQEVYQIAADEFDKGYVHPDTLTINWDDFGKQNMMNDVSFIYTIQNGIGDAATASKTFSNVYGFDCVAIPLHTEYFIKNGWGAGGNGVTASSQHPEEAIRFIQALNTEKGKELYNLIVYGIEGVHYEKVDDTHIKTLQYDGSQGGVDTSYAAMKWIIGNTFNAYLNQGCVEGENELSLQINENPDNLVSDIAGFTAKTENIETQLEQVKAVYTEYQRALQSGVMGASGWKAYYDEFAKKLEAAGLPDILAEFQTQLDAFYANKK